jgi:hypothetical protein
VCDILAVTIPCFSLFFLQELIAPLTFIHLFRIQLHSNQLSSSSPTIATVFSSIRIVFFFCLVFPLHDRFSIVWLNDWLIVHFTLSEYFHFIFSLHRYSRLTHNSHWNFHSLHIHFTTYSWIDWLLSPSHFRWILPLTTSHLITYTLHLLPSYYFSFVFGAAFRVCRRCLCVALCVDCGVFGLCFFPFLADQVAHFIGYVGQGDSFLRSIALRYGLHCTLEERFVVCCIWFLSILFGCWMNEIGSSPFPSLLAFFFHFPLGIVSSVPPLSPSCPFPRF